MESTVSGFCWCLTYLLPEDLIWGFGALGFPHDVCPKTLMGQVISSTWARDSHDLFDFEVGIAGWSHDLLCEPWTLLGGYRYSLISWVSQQDEGLDAANDFRELDVTYMYIHVYLETMMILAHDISNKLVTFFLVGFFSQHLGPWDVLHCCDGLWRSPGTSPSHQDLHGASIHGIQLRKKSKRCCKRLKHYFNKYCIRNIQ